MRHADKSRLEAASRGVWCWLLHYYSSWFRVVAAWQHGVDPINGWPLAKVACLPWLEHQACSGILRMPERACVCGTARASSHCKHFR